MNTRINWSEDQATFCCGLMEIGNIENVHPAESDWQDAQYDAKTSEEALNKMRESNKNFPIMFNFIREVPKDFRDLVQAQKDWILIHKWRNPNTGNIITCGMLTNGSNQARKIRKGV